MTTYAKPKSGHSHKRHRLLKCVAKQWWEFGQQKKKISPPPPKFPANTLPAPRLPRPHPPGRPPHPPPGWDFPLKIAPPPTLPAPRTPLPLPRAEKKISETSTEKQCSLQQKKAQDRFFPVPCRPSLSHFGDGTGNHWVDIPFPIVILAHYIC